jgi:hypothetical protein
VSNRIKKLQINLKEKIGMSATRTIKISALNIAMHQPHSAQRYVSLFKDAKRLNYLVRLGSVHGAMLGSLYGPKSGSELSELTGEIFRFVKLDPTEPWFNLETSDVATDDDVEQINIPNNLLPHLQRIEFVFKPLVHELWFVSSDRQDRMGSQAATKFFQALFDRLIRNGKYPEVEVTALPDKETLDQLMSLPTLEKITIELKRPNGDDAGSDEVKWLKRLEKQSIRMQTTELVAVKGESIKPDDETRALADVASRNGNVSVVGRDATGMRVEESTKERPLVISALVNSEMETSMDVLLQVALSQ